MKNHFRILAAGAFVLSTVVTVSLVGSPVGAASKPKPTVVTKPKPKPKAPAKKAPAKSVSPQKSSAPVPVKTEQSNPLGSAGEIDFGGPDAKWTLRFLSPATNTAGLWPPGREVPSPPGKSWYTLQAEIKNLNSKTAQFNSIGVSFYSTQDRTNNINFLSIDIPLDEIPNCLEGSGGPDVPSGQTYKCRFFIQTDPVELPTVYGFVEQYDGRLDQRFLLR